MEIYPSSFSELYDDIYKEYEIIQTLLITSYPYSIYTLNGISIFTDQKFVGYDISF